MMKLEKLTQVINALNEKTKIAYESHNKPMYIEVAGEVKAKNTYDEDGRLLITSDGLGNTYTFSYDTKINASITKNKASEVMQPDDSTLTFRYDEKGNISKLSDASGTKSLYAYTDKGQLESLTHEDANGILDRYQYTYDIQGNKT